MSSSGKLAIWLIGVAWLAGCSDESVREPSAVVDYAANAERWIASEFQPSTLSVDEQRAELAWFTAAADPLRGMEVSVVS
ncbi:MAG: hypothetical protein ACE1ZA_14805, partial [Pseudomonadales bacterium]